MKDKNKIFVLREKDTHTYIPTHALYIIFKSLVT